MSHDHSIIPQTLKEDCYFMNTPKVTILLPNYKTLELTKLCLRLLRKHTDSSLAKIIVIDNDSQDTSLDYLRTLNWIELIERKADPSDTPALSHSRALDLALAKVDTPYVLSLHTDTLVKNAQWLPFLLNKIETNTNIGGVGSWKLEQESVLKRYLKKIEKMWQLFYSRVTNKKHAISGSGDNFYYLRSHCALYRMDLIKKYNLSFSQGDAVAGKMMHKALVDNGYQMVFLPSEILIRYLDHINHATMVLNSGMLAPDKTDKGIKRVRKALNEFNADQILKMEELDM